LNLAQLVKFSVGIFNVEPRLVTLLCMSPASDSRKASTVSAGLAKNL